MASRTDPPIVNNLVPAASSDDVASRTPTSFDGVLERGCVTLDEWGGLTFAEMPSSELVRQAMAPLLERYHSKLTQAALLVTSPPDGRGLSAPSGGYPFFADYTVDDAAEAGAWFDLDLDADALDTGWGEALSARERMLADNACRLLAGKIVGSAVYVALDERSRAYDAMTEDDREAYAAPGWGAGVRRGTVDRLLDRLRLNHPFIDYRSLDGVDPAATETWIAYRVASFYRTSGRRDFMTTTRFGRVAAENPWVRLRSRLEGSTPGPLGLVFGILTGPDDLALPLDWGEAVDSGISEGESLRIRRDDDLWDGLDDAADTLEIDGALGDLVGLLGLDYFGPLTDALRDATSEDRRPLNEVAGLLLEGLRGLRDRSFLGWTIGLDTLVSELLGLDDDELQVLAGALHPFLYQPEVPGLVPADLAPPRVLLGEEFAAVAELFAPLADPEAWEGNDRSYSQDNLKALHLYVEGDDSLVVFENQELADKWSAWWNAARPCVDAACVFDTAGRILEQLLYLDDGLLAANRLATAEGPVGDVVRAGLSSTEARWLLHGVAPGRLIHYLVRQILTDYLLGQLEYEVTSKGGEWPDSTRYCLYQIFCWMNTTEKREAIEEVLGDVGSYALPSKAQSQLGVSTLHLRSTLEWLLDDPGMNRASWYAAAANAGALARVLAAAFESSEESSDEDFDDLVDRCDLLAVRRWLRLSAESCLGDLRERLQPEFVTIGDYIDWRPSGVPSWDWL